MSCHCPLLTSPFVEMTISPVQVLCETIGRHAWRSVRQGGLIRRLLLLSFPVVLAGACSKNSPAAPSSQSQTFRGTVSASGNAGHTLDITKSGVMILTLTWSSGSDNLNLSLTRPSCLNVAVGCVELAGSESDSGTRETITWHVTAGDTYKAWVLSQAVRGVNYTLQFDVP